MVSINSFFFSVKNNFEKFLLPALALTVCLTVFAPAKVFAAASYSVCAAGCDFTTIEDAFASGLGIGDTVTVEATYDPTGESYPLDFPVGATDITLDCQDSGIEIGPGALPVVEINLGVNSTVQNCKFADIDLHEESDGAVITNNIFTNAKATAIPPAQPKITTISFLGAGDFTVSNNTSIGRIDINGGSNGTISGNTVLIYNAVSNGFGININSATGVNFTNNSIINYADWTGFVGNLAMINVNDSTDILFDNNTIRSDDNPNCNHCWAVQVGSADNVSFTNNYVWELPFSNADQRAIRYQPDPGESSTGTVEHNSFFCPADVTSCTLLDIFPGNIGSSADITVNYNLFYNYAGVLGSYAIRAAASEGATVSVSNDYNGFWNFFSNLEAPGTDITPGSHTKTSDPFLMDEDVDLTNDLYPVSFSLYRDVNDGEDIGAYGDKDTVTNDYPRRSTIYIDDTGSIDYSTVDDIQIDNIFASLKNGDTIQFADGTYDPFSLVAAGEMTGSITVNGSGAGTIISSGGAEDDIEVHINNSTISNLTVQDADSPIPPTYDITVAVFNYDGNDYNDGAMVDAAPNSAFVLTNAETCEPNNYSADGYDVTDIVGGATSNWNLALLRVGGMGDARLVFLMPNNIASDPGQIESGCAPYDVVVEKWIPDIFTVSGGVFTYNAVDVAAAGVTLLPGFTDPPDINRTMTLDYDGIGFYDGASNNTVSNVQSINNYIGISFKGTSSGNVVEESSFESNAYDVGIGTASDNTFRNVSFDRTKMAFTDTGVLNVEYKARAYVTDESSAPVSGASVDFTSANDAATTTLETDGTGYTPYSDYLPAMTLSAEDSSETAGGYNPYAVTATTPGSRNLSENLNTVNRTFNVVHNFVPVASDVSITGTANVGNLLTGNYTYSDVDGDLEGTSTFRWLRDAVTIDGAISNTYTLVSADIGKTITF